MEEIVVRADNIGDTPPSNKGASSIDTDGGYQTQRSPFIVEDGVNEVFGSFYAQERGDTRGTKLTAVSIR